MAAGPRHPERVFASLAQEVWERDLVTGEAWRAPRHKALPGFKDHELPNTIETMRARVHPEAAIDSNGHGSQWTGVRS